MKPLCNSDLESILSELHINVYTLADGSRIIAEEKSYDYVEGESVLFGVLEFRELTKTIKLVPYVPGTLTSDYVINHDLIIAAAAAELSIRINYYNSLVYYTLLNKGFESEASEFSSFTVLLNHSIETQQNTEETTEFKIHPRFKFPNF